MSGSERGHGIVAFYQQASPLGPHKGFLVGVPQTLIRQQGGTHYENTQP